MANTPQSKKRARQGIKRRARNASQRSMMRTQLKKVVAAIASGEAETAKAEYAAVVPVLDSMVSKGLIHKHKAARHKSRLNAQIKALAA